MVKIYAKYGCIWYTYGSSWSINADFFMDTSWECHRRNGCNGADTKASHGFKSRIVLYSTKPLLSRRCTTRRPNRTFLLVWSTHSTPEWTNFEVSFVWKQVMIIYSHLFSVFVSKDLERWRAFSVFVSLFHIFEKLGHFALSQALGPAGVLLTRGEDGNAILVRRLRLWTSRE